MIVTLIISMITMVICLEPNNDINDDIKTIIGKYLNKIPDIEPRYIINDKLSKVINHFFKGKISTLPLYKISLKIDRNPVKIPWSSDNVEEQQDYIGKQRAADLSDEQEDKKDVKHYKVVKTSDNHSPSEATDRQQIASNATVASEVTSETATTPAPLQEIQ